MHRITNNIFIDDNYSSWENENYCFYWEGLIFVRGILSGSKSLENFSNILDKQGIERAARFLSGTFFLVVQDKKMNDYYCLADNSGLFQAYYSEFRISTSFLHLIQLEKLTTSDLDKRAVVEFIHLGNIFFNRTFFNRIKKIDGDQIFNLNPEGSISILEKELPPLFGDPPSESILSIFDNITKSLRNQKISIDLTGGLDSRLLVVLFRHFGLNFKTGAFGADDHPDVTISRQVAQKLGVDHTTASYTTDNLEEKLEEAYQICGGLSDPVLAVITLDLHKKHRSRHVELAISGNGGEIFDDFFWLQDYPFYNSHQIHLQRLFEFRFRPLAPIDPEYFTSPYGDISKNLTESFVKDLSQFTLDTNTKTYAHIFAKVRWKELSGMSMTRFKRFVNYYSPYMEYDVTRIALNLPTNQHINSRYQKELLASLNPEIANMPFLGRNYLTLMKYSFLLGRNKEYFFKLGQYLIQKFGQSIANFLIPIVKTHKISSGIKALPSINKYSQILHDSDILSKKTSLSSINLPFLGRFISLAKLLKQLSILNN